MPKPDRTPVAYDEADDFELTDLNGGGGINPMNLSRDPNDNCSPIYPTSICA